MRICPFGSLRPIQVAVHSPKIGVFLTSGVVLSQTMLCELNFVDKDRFQKTIEWTVTDLLTQFNVMD